MKASHHRVIYEIIHLHEFLTYVMWLHLYVYNLETDLILVWQK